MIDLHALFEKHDKEYLHFERVEHKRSSRPDINAFILIDSLLPFRTGPMVAFAEHDEIGLDLDLDQFAEVASEEHVIELVRCGVVLEQDFFYMRV